MRKEVDLLNEAFSSSSTFNKCVYLVKLINFWNSIFCCVFLSVSQSFEEKLRISTEIVIREPGAFHRATLMTNRCHIFSINLYYH